MLLILYTADGIGRGSDVKQHFLSYIQYPLALFYFQINGKYLSLSVVKAFSLDVFLFKPA